MKIKRREDVPSVAKAGCPGVGKQVVLGPADGSEEVALRYFTVDAGAASPHHAHDFPRLVRVEAGRGVAVDGEGNEAPISAGDYVYVASNEMHTFKNAGRTPIEFICIVPGRGEPPTAGGRRTG